MIDDSCKATRTIICLYVFQTTHVFQVQIKLHSNNIKI